MKHTSKTKQFLTFWGWKVKYSWVNKKQGIEQGLFSMAVLNKEINQKLSMLPDSNMIKSLSKRGLPKVKVHQKLYIDFSNADILDESTNLYTDEVPKIASEDLDMPFELNIKNYDPDQKIKIRLISKYDWGQVNWKKGVLKDPESEPTTMPAALFYIYGGGFKAGSTGIYNRVIRKYSIKTGCPIFAVDYRLSPKYKFPTHLNDCWQAYLWVRYYSEKYLKVRFDKILLIGDSAGGNLSVGITNLAIKKKCIKPDGLIFSYPSMCTDRNYMHPSIAFTIDEPFLNTQFLDFCLSSYYQDDKSSAGYLASPIYTPYEILKEFPPIRMGIAGIDPFRDTSLDFFRMCVKLGVDIKGKLYRHLFHGYLGMSGPPLNLKDCLVAVRDIYDYIQEVLSI